VLAEWLLVGSLSLLARLRGQRARGLLELNDALVTVLLTANLFGHRRGLLHGGGLFGLLVLNKGGLLVVHLGPRKFHDPAVDLGVARSVSHGFTFF